MNDELKKYLDINFSCLATKEEVQNGFRELDKRIDTLDELIDFLNKRIGTETKTISEQVAKNAESITEVQNTLERIEGKIDGVRNSLDNEIIRQTDKNAKHERRISHLESLHGIGAT